MANKKPTHEIRLGTIRAAIWAHENRQNQVWFNVTVTRVYKDDLGWRDSSTFNRDDLPVVAKIMEMAYVWIWDQQLSTSR
jgi:hypothetical protein